MAFEEKDSVILLASEMKLSKTMEKIKRGVDGRFLAFLGWAGLERKEFF